MAIGILATAPDELAPALREFVKKNVQEYKEAKKGIDYYKGQNDIKTNKIYYVDENGSMKEDKYASNVRIPHRFMRELVDQKVQYLLSNPIEIGVPDEKLELEDILAEYYNEDFQQMLQDVISNASQKGFEYVYAQQNSSDRVEFKVADGLKILPVFDNMGNVVRLVRVWEEEIGNEGQKYTLHHAEVYDSQNIYYFVAKNNDNYMLDPSKEINPTPHVVVAKETINGTEVSGRSYGTIPFYRLQNNAEEETDLAPIKELIDDYDIMNAYMSNNLQDMTEAIYVLQGDVDTTVDNMRMNIKAKHAIITGDTDTKLDVKTFNIPYEGRKAKMELDKENIYKFGMGFDNSQVGDGNVTNIVLLSRYSLLDMKANKTETRLRSLLRWINSLVLNDINRKLGTTYVDSDVEFIINRKLLVNASDQAQVDKLEADTISVKIQTLADVAPFVDNETLVRAMCAELDLDYDEVAKAKDTEEYANNGVGITE